MPATHTVDDEGRYDGRRLEEAAQLAIGDVVAAANPQEIILFGSVARGEDTADSDIDLLVVVDEVELVDRARLMTTIRSAISVFAPFDVFVVGVDELEAGRDNVGSMAFWALRDGQRLYRRRTSRAG